VIKRPGYGAARIRWSALIDFEIKQTCSVSISQAILSISKRLEVRYLATVLATYEAIVIAKVMTEVARLACVRIMLELET
jgi:hypothetical protein